jgi:hypothetical protein
MILALRLLDLKCKHNFTNNAFSDILNLVEGKGNDKKSSSFYKTKEKLNELVDIELNHVDMCKNSCCAYTGIYTDDLACRFCSLERYTVSSNSKKAKKSQKTAICR